METESTTSIVPVVVVERKALTAALKKLGQVVLRRSSKEILKNVLIRRNANASWVTLSATNLDVSLKLWVKCEEGESPDVEFLVNLESLAGAVRTSKSDRCILHAFPDRVVVNGGAVRHSLQTGDLKEYPPLGLQFTGRKFVFGINNLAHALKIGLVGVAKENTRYAINGVLLEVKDGRCNVVATDGRRLVQINVGTCYEGESGAECATILPAHVCKLAVDLAGKLQTGTVHVYTEQAPLSEGAMAPDHLWLVGPDWIIGTRCVEGHFPNYREVIPRESDNNSHYLLNAREMAEVVKQVGVATDESSKGVRTTWDGNNCVTVSAASYCHGEADAQVPCKFLGEGDRYVVTGFNPAFLLDICNTIPTHNMVCYLRQNRAGLSIDSITQYPIMVKSENDLVTWVLMPVQCGLKNCPEHLGSNYVPPEVCWCGKELADGCCEEHGDMNDPSNPNVREPETETAAA